MKRVYVVVLVAALVVAGWSIYRLSRPHGALTDELGCHVTSTSHPDARTTKQICTRSGRRLVIWSLGKGDHSIHPPAWVRGTVLAPQGKDWVVGCARTSDCDAIQRQEGGLVSTEKGLLGISLSVG